MQRVGAMHGMAVSCAGSREPSTFCLSLARNSTWIRLAGSQALRIPLPLLPMSRHGDHRHALYLDSGHGKGFTN